jgi:O-succinylbenzoate synthase
VVAVELVRVRLPLRTPLRAAHGTEAERDVVLVRVVDRVGIEGWGECSALARPTYTAEHTAGAWAVLVDELVPALLAGERSPVVGHPMAKASLATALADLSARAAGRPLASRLGGTRPSVPTTAVVGLDDDLDTLLARVGEAVEAGASMVKVKIRPGLDVEALRAVRGAFAELPLAADANGAYGSAEEVPVAALDALGLAYLEQPLPADDLVGAARLAARMGTPLALDESVGSAGRLEAALALGALRVLNVKPARVGGPAEAVSLGRRAVEHGVEAFVGGMLETGVGRAAALAVASVPVFALPTDLGPSSRYFAEDLTTPIELVEGRLPVPTGPGLGVRPVPELLARRVVDRLLLRA